LKKILHPLSGFQSLVRLYIEREKLNNEKRRIFMPNYMMLLHEAPPDFSQFSAEDIQHVIDEYKNWRNRVAAQGKLVGGAKIGGYFTIEAADYNEAVEICSDCPHLTYGGRIELREVEPT
jgi:hypothetical protein